MSENQDLKIDTLPNRLSFLRIICVPFVVFFLRNDDPWNNFFAGVVFGIAGITDYFDGYYARIQKAGTVIGQLLDPLADKFLVVGSLIMLMYLGRINEYIVIILICREMAITGLRSIASSQGIIIPASKLAKWKTATQMTAIPMLMLHHTYLMIPFQLLGTIFVWLSLIISLWSAKDYIVDFFKGVKARSSEAAQRRRERKAQRKVWRQKQIEAKKAEFNKKYPTSDS